MFTTPQLIAMFVAVVVGWIACKFISPRLPSEKALALKAGIAALKKLNALESTTPEELANVAAQQAREAAMVEAFKDEAAKLR